MNDQDPVVLHSRGCPRSIAASNAYRQQKCLDTRLSARGTNWMRSLKRASLLAIRLTVLPPILEPVKYSGDRTRPVLSVMSPPG